MDCYNLLNKLFENLLPTFHTMLSLIHPYVSNFRQVLPDPGVLLELLRPIFIWAIFATVLWLLYTNDKKKKKKKTTPISKAYEVAGKSPAVSGSEIEFHDAIEGEPFMVSDFNYSTELQIQEVILASLSPQFNNTSSSMQETILSDPELAETDNVAENLSQSFCEICLENKESWQMFINDTCSHSFCYECTSKHIAARIQDNPKTIKCPGANCNVALDFNDCRLMIPKDVLAQWDAFLCMSVIPDSQKLFCPYRDCSAMLIDDSQEVIKEINCPACQRSFCAICRVPWHSNFTCKEFQKLNAKKAGKDELMFKSLAKKKNWPQCPSCKMHVEKSEGCTHMTCRCSYEFCYRCGSKWSGSHECKKS